MTNGEISAKIRRTAAALAAALLLSAAAACGSLPGPAALAGTASAPASAKPATQAPTAAPAPMATPAPTSTPSPTPPGALPEADYALFARVGFSAVKGDSPAIGKWDRPIRVQAAGHPDRADAEALGDLVKKLEGVRGMPAIEFVTEGGNLTVSFLPLKQAAQADGSFNDTGLAQAHIAWDGCSPASANAFVADELEGRAQRDAAIAGLLFRSLGLLQDLAGEFEGSAPDPLDASSGPSGLDWTMLALLYSPEIAPGLTQACAMAAVRALDPDLSSVASASGGEASPADALSYFNEVGFWWNGGASDGFACKWAVPVRLQVAGSPAPAQRQLLDEYVGKLNRVQGFPGLNEVSSGGALVVDFQPASEIRKVYPGMTAAESCCIAGPGQSGGKISTCTIYVATDFADEAAGRTQFLRLLMKAMGFAFTSEAWPDSILDYSSNVQDWSALDWQMAALLYRPDVKPGAKRAAVMKMLENDSK